MRLALNLLMIAATGLSAQEVPTMQKEPDECFMSVLSRPFHIEVTTTEQSTARHLGHGDILCADGELQSVRIRFLPFRVGAACDGTK